jgi:Family of unknown function (DUF6928)
MLAYSDGKASEILRSNPRLDRDAAVALAQLLFPAEKLEVIGDGDLSYTNPPDREIYVGCFPGLSIVAAQEFGGDYPSRLPLNFIDASKGRTLYLHAMHSVVDWFAYAIWEDRKIRRSLSLSPDSGILEDIGPRLPFEEPYWAGKHPVFFLEDAEGEDEEYPFPFHPLELGEAALREFFGYQLEGRIDPTALQPEQIPLVKLRRAKAWWKFW